MKTILVLVCLTFFVSANDYDLLQEMTQYEFGKTIIATLQIELQNGDGAIDNVIQQLKSMQTNADSDLKENDTNLRNRQEQCNLRFTELQTVMDSATIKKIEDERTYPIKQEELIAKKQQLKDKEGQEQRNQDRITLLDQQRQAEKENFKEKSNETVEFIQGLKKAKSIISQLKSSFLQIEDVQEKLKKHMSSLNKSSPYYGLVAMLVESADEESVHKVVQIIDELVEVILLVKKSLQHLQKVDRQGDEQKESLYIQQKARYELENKGLEASVAGLQADTEKLKQTLLELKNDIESKDQLLNGKQIELGDWTKTCNDEVKNSQMVRQQKNDELNIINECIEIFSSRFNSGIRSFVQKLEI